MRSTPVMGWQRSAEGRLLTIERLLRRREAIWQQIVDDYELGPLIRQLAGSTAIALACYGAIMGTASGHVLQVIASAIKLPLLFLLTLAVCMPTFYLYNLIYGGRLSVQQGLCLVLTALTVTSTFTLAFGPVALFFRFAAWNYDFFFLVNLAILTLTSVVGFQVFVVGARQINRLAERLEQEAPAGDGDEQTHGRPINIVLLYIWFVFALFIGTQLYWTLRPFFGSPAGGFELFAPASEGNFYIGLLDAVLHLRGR